MSRQSELARHFLGLHRRDSPLLLANAWDVGSAKLLGSLGFQALATTSSGHAATLGRRDGGVSRDEALAHAAAIVAATELPVSADLEDGFADDPDGVSATVTAAVATGLAGCSIEDATGRENEPIHPFELAVARVAAAAGAAHAGDASIVLTARAENHLHGRDDLDDTIKRLQAFEAAGADVVFAPGVVRSEDIARVVAAVSCPVNVLAFPGTPAVAELAQLGVGRVSVGGGFAFAAYGALVQDARELLDDGTYGYMQRLGVGAKAVRGAFPQHAESATRSQ